jgi:hypothetical protein
MTVSRGKALSISLGVDKIQAPPTARRASELTTIGFHGPNSLDACKFMLMVVVS